MPRNTQQEQDAIILQTVPLALGAAGLDLRTPTSANALTKLLNARFRDDRTLERRNGYAAVQYQDGDSFASGANDPNGWVYGHGQQLTDLIDAHYPIPQRGKGVFQYEGSKVVWTGDRLLVDREGDAAIGSSSFWNRSGTDALKRGIPAYLPTQLESSPPDVVTGDYVETCITPTLRVVVASSDEEDLIAWVSDRTTGAVLDRTDIVTAGNGIYEPRVINSDGAPVLLWLDGTDLFKAWWSGSAWTQANLIADDVRAYEVTEYPGGFVVAWQKSDDTVSLGAYLGHTTDNSTFDYGTTLIDVTAAGAMALTASPDGAFALVYQNSSNLHLRAAYILADTTVVDDFELDATVGPYDGGLAACFRGIPSSTDRYNFVVHAGNGGIDTRLYEVTCDETALSLIKQDKRFRTKLASKSFRIGDEVFCWLQTRNSESNYLVAGVSPQVCGICDREEAPSRIVRDTGEPGYGVKGIPMVYVDPENPYNATWIRPYTTSRVITIDDEKEKVEDLYNRAGNCRIGDLNFLPQLSAVQYGESVYLAGSHVRNYDGIELGDAGFHDYPTVELSQSNGAGLLTAETTYDVRVYPVRYNKRGERFQGSALTTAVTLDAGSDTIGCSIATIPVTNHDDVMFEVWVTEGNGTTFYLDGTVANDLAASTVSYSITLADAVRRLRAGDPHAPGVGIAAEVQEMGPLGCEILAVAGDRLWGAGGAVPAGFVQFSKLKEPNEAAGFDVLGGYQQVDTQGGRITSIAGYADSIIIFQRDQLAQMYGDGPNNYGTGSYQVPQLHLVDGAINHFGTRETAVGLAYWGLDGPRMLAPNMRVDNISLPIRQLTKAMTPSGVQYDTHRQEIVWFSEDGTAVLWNHLAGSRWAEWTGLKIAGVCASAIVTTDGRLFTESEDAYGDGGAPFEFAGASSELSGGAFGGNVELNSVGIAGEYLGSHRLRMRIYYNGSPLWSDSWIWEPDSNTWLASGDVHADRTPAQIDADSPRARNGAYATHKKVNQHECRHFRVEWSDIRSDRPTYRPYEVTLEVGTRGGMGRVPVNSFGS